MNKNEHMTGFYVQCSIYFRLVIVSCFLLPLMMTMKLTAKDHAGSISVAMLGDLSPPKVLNRGFINAHRHAVNFLNNIFGTYGEKGIAEKKIWPPIYTENCPGMTSHFDRDIPYQRGCILAHKQIWEEFVVKHKNVPATISIYESPKIVIFEDDAMEIDPLAHPAAYLSVRNMTSNLHYLGYCFNFQPERKPPLCCHAYVLTLAGARYLLSSGVMDWCVRNKNTLDEQLQTLGASGAITWTAVTNQNPFGISDSYIRNKSLTDGFSIGLVEKWEGGEGGLFYQVKYESDDPVMLQEKGLYKVSGSHSTRTLYQYIHGFFYIFPNIKTFNSMGYHVNQIIEIPRSQLRRFVNNNYFVCKNNNGSSGIVRKPIINNKNASSNPTAASKQLTNMVLQLHSHKMTHQVIFC